MFVSRPAVPIVSWRVESARGDHYIVAQQPMLIRLTDHRVDDAAVFSIINAPAGMTIHPETGVASWTPSVGDIGHVTANFRATNSVGSTDVSISFTVLFSGPVSNLSAVRNPERTWADVRWHSPLDNVRPVASYLVTLHWRWQSRPRSRTVTVPGNVSSTMLALVPHGAVHFTGVTVTPVDQIGMRGTPLLVPLV
jgi:hypothetical protein